MTLENGKSPFFIGYNGRCAAYGRSPAPKDGKRRPTSQNMSKPMGFLRFFVEVDQWLFFFGKFGTFHIILYLYVHIISVDLPEVYFLKFVIVWPLPQIDNLTAGHFPGGELLRGVTSRVQGRCFVFSPMPSDPKMGGSSPETPPAQEKGSCSFEGSNVWKPECFFFSGVAVDESRMEQVTNVNEEYDSMWFSYIQL